MKIILKQQQWFTIIVTLCLIAIASFAVSGCDKTETSPKHYTVNFVGEGVVIEPQSITHGNCVTVPEISERESCTFGGWFTDNGTFANEWDFETDIVTQDTTLYAKWKENTSQEINLEGTKWKLVGIGSLDKIALQELEPKDCEKCYTLTFDTDKSFLTFSSTNELQGIYNADYTAHTIQIVDFGGSKINEIGDGILYVNPFGEMVIQSFSLQGSELRLYYSEKKNYLLFKSLEL